MERRRLPGIPAGSPPQSVEQYFEMRFTPAEARALSEANGLSAGSEELAILYSPSDQRKLFAAVARLMKRQLVIGAKQPDPRTNDLEEARRAIYGENLESVSAFLAELLPSAYQANENLEALRFELQDVDAGRAPAVFKGPLRAPLADGDKSKPRKLIPTNTIRRRAAVAAAYGCLIASGKFKTNAAAAKHIANLLAAERPSNFGCRQGEKITGDKVERWREEFETLEARDSARVGYEHFKAGAIDEGAMWTLLGYATANRVKAPNSRR